MGLKKELEVGDPVNITTPVKIQGVTTTVAITGGEVVAVAKYSVLVKYSIKDVDKGEVVERIGWWGKDCIQSRVYVGKTDEEFYEEATKIPEAEYPNQAVWFNDEYFYSIDDFKDTYQDKEERQEYVWACRYIDFVSTSSLDLVGYLVDILEDQAFEGFSEMLQFQTIYAALRDIETKVYEVARQTPMFEADMTRAVIIDWEGY